MSVFAWKHTIKCLEKMVSHLQLVFDWYHRLPFLQLLNNKVCYSLSLLCSTLLPWKESPVIVILIHRISNSLQVSGFIHLIKNLSFITCKTKWLHVLYQHLSSPKSISISIIHGSYQVCSDPISTHWFLLILYQ